MTHVDETPVVHFSYRVQPQFAFSFLTEGQRASSSLADVFSVDHLTSATAMPDTLRSDIAVQDTNGALLMLAREEAAHRPKIRPVRHFALTPGRTACRTRSRAMTDGCVVRPAYPTHLLIVSARRARPARLAPIQPSEAAIAATRAALCWEGPTAPTPGLGLRTAMHFIAIAGLFTTVAETAAAQQVLALF